MDRLKKPDIRLHVARPPAVVGIEIKIADSWRMPQLEAALERQLVGQYLRDARSRHGVLLLFHSGRTQYWKSGTTKLTFDDVVKRLTEMACRLPGAEGLQVRVVAIDCRGGCGT